MSDLPAATGGGIIPAQYNQQQIQLIRDIREKIRPHTERVLCVEHFSEWWDAQKEVQA